MSMRVPSYRLWKFERVIPEPKLPDGRSVVQGLSGKLYVNGVGKNQESMVRYFYKGKVVFAAWGVRKAKHCGAHAIKNPKGGWFPVVIGCPVVLPRKNVAGQIQGLLLKTPTSTLRY